MYFGGVFMLLDKRTSNFVIKKSINDIRTIVDLIHHLDRWSQHSSIKCQNKLRETEKITSVSHKENCCDNACIELFKSNRI